MIQDPRPDWVEKMNGLANAKTPFFALISFDGQEGSVRTLAECEQDNILFHTENYRVESEVSTSDVATNLHFIPPTFELYERQFNHVMHEIKHGNSYLLNLCVAIEIVGELNLKEIYQRSKAPYKVYVPDEFICFSPERFIKIESGFLSTYPMKGTIDARLANAETILREDEKEIAEHYTIVDLLRNDIGMVCDEVNVSRFAYIEEINTSKGPILQMSSEIGGRVSEAYQAHLGDLFYRLLPAGSISGAPKQKTVEIINRVENFDRSFYTGVMVYFDGENIDSGVMIRFIEKDEQGKYFYKSGGGITHKSEVRKEYEEIIKKVYLPIF